MDIPDYEYDHITVVDPHVKKESQDDKYGILDVKVQTKSGNVINVEIQDRSDKDGTEFTNLIEINTLELSKLPQEEDNSELWYWMKFIKSDDGEVLNMLARRNLQISKAVGILKELSADERTRMLYEQREIARRDMVSRMDGAKRERSFEIARNLLNTNLSHDEIVTATGLSLEEVKSLRLGPVKE